LLSIGSCSVFGCGNYDQLGTESVTETIHETGIENEITDSMAEVFVDARGGRHSYEVNEEWLKNDYNKEAFVLEDGLMTYSDSDEYVYRNGIDVSKFQGEIDWKQVKEAGYDFAFIRIGYRGYGEEGVIKEDEYAAQNLKGAYEAGLDVGVYFFSQAVNEKESVEEAEFVLSLLEEYDFSAEKLALPIVFDPESILDDEARTDDVTGAQFTENTIAFIERIQEAGYRGMIYCNMLWQAYELDLSKLEAYPLWYADYEPQPQSPYAFAFWQYSDTSEVPGIDGIVDVNIQLIKK